MNDMVSIITPMYNSSKFIHWTVQSVLSQVYKNWEMIIIDDCSTDSSVDIIKSYIKKMNYICTPSFERERIGGKKKVMDCLAPNGPVYQAGTLSGNPLAMAAGSTLIKLLIDKNPYKDLESKAKNLLEGMKEIFDRYDIPFSTNQIGGMFGFFFSEELPSNLVDVENTNDKQFKKFLNKCIDNGIYFAPSKFEAGFISTKHTKTEISNTIKIVEKILKEGI